ncbi:relaxase [Dyadobacter luteus]|uniref:Relaxase n=1 Tax=Dyadobacter luteus TaxID=2259619 RepID=A0A3D8YGE7_9BACT|nr:relaxase/mobilization nuclease domain-containing protein [Dyadobacter luteus]REA63436.1 relaxase [Dyadobacter luteus]
MVAVINTGKSIRAAFMYNENKVAEGVADLIMAGNYPMETDDMNQMHRLNMLLKTAANNDNIKRNSVHISLNFAPGEQLGKDTLAAIAADYMERIGFGGQPFLVYEHKDVAHQHLHIVSVKVRPDGSRIDMNNIGKVQSQQARKVLEIKYGLVKAEQQNNAVSNLKPVSASRVGYGKSETRRAIYKVLCAVLKPYKYTSLAELNAVLRLYNVTAERGSETSRTHRHRGLLYRMLDSEGKPVGVPIKASLFPDSFPGRPTLKYIESRFLINETLRQDDKKRVKAAIDFALINAQRTTLQDMIKELNGKGITTVLRQNQQSVLYGITFIDHQKKAVFNGSDLGKQYSASGILSRCKQAEKIPHYMNPNLSSGRISASQSNSVQAGRRDFLVAPAGSEKESGVIDALLKVEYGADYLPGQWKARRKKKRRNQSNNL